VQPPHPNTSGIDPVPALPASSPDNRRFWAWALNAYPARRSLWKRLLVAVVITLLAAWLRVMLAPAESGGRFVTLSLAVVLATVYGGAAAGLLSTVLGMLIVNFFLVKPYFSLAFDNPMEAFWLNGWHLITQLVVIGAISLVQQKNQRLREASEAARQTHRQYMATFEQAAAGMTHVGLDGTLLRVNQHFCDMVGYPREQLLRMRFQDITHPDDIADDVGLLEQAIAGKRSDYTLEKRYFHSDGHIVWVKLTVALIRDDRGEPDFFISVVQDITETKATNQALRTSEQLMRQAARLAGLATWTVDLSTMRFRTLFDSQRMLGLAQEEFTRDDLVAMCHPDDRERMSRNWYRGVRGEASYTDEYRVIINGEERWFLAQAEFERDAAGQAIRGLGVTYDITPRKRVELQIQDLNATLEARIRERTQQLRGAYNELESYSYAVAHDLRSPLRIINGFAQAIQEDHPDFDAPTQDNLRRIMSASRQMGLLIDGLLKLSQFSRGELQRVPVSISHMARSQCEDLTREHPGRQVDWTVEPGLTTEADPLLVEALLQNLLGNAWKYTAHQPVARIRVYGKIVNGQRWFCVCDNGAGFDMSRAAKLFQPFQRLHQPGEFAGLGIGLATSKRIVERHGGTIEAESSPGEGATFCFTLTPVAGGPSSAA